MRRLFIIIGAVAWFVTLGIVSPTVGVAGTLDEVKNRGVLIVGVRYDMPPYGFVDKSGDVVGIDIEIIKHVAGKLGVKLELKQVTSKTRIPFLVNGDVDVLAAGIAHTIKREKVIDYTVTYMESGNLFLVRKGSGINSYRDLKGKIIATIQGTPYITGLRRKEPDFEVLTFQEYPQAILALEQGKADALMADDTTLVSFIGGREGLEIVGSVRDFPRWFVGLAVRENDSDWRDFLNVTLIEMWQNGELQQIMSDAGFKYDPAFEVEVWKF